MNYIYNCPFCNVKMIKSQNDSFFGVKCENKLCEVPDKLDSARFNYHYTLPFEIDYYSFYLEEQNTLFKIYSSKISQLYQFTSICKAKSVADEILNSPIVFHDKFIPLPDPISDIKQIYTRLTQLSLFL